MPNVGRMLRDEIARLSRREIRKQTDSAKKAASEHRHRIAALNKRVAQLERRVALLLRQVTRQQQAEPAGASDGSSLIKFRFVAKGLRSHRSRLGLSANEFGRLVGVGANSVYAWEQGKAAPRNEQLAKIAALRGVGKREAARRLETMGRLTTGPRRKR